MIMSQAKNILILGGYGSTGLAIARLLLRDSDHNIGLAGREQVRADWEAKALNWEHSCDRVQGVQVNLGFKKQLTGIMEGYDLVIDNIGETAFKGQAARAALDSGIAYLGLISDKDKLLALKGMDIEIQAEELTFITGADIFPGVSFLMARYLSGFFDVLDTATIDGLPGEETYSYRSGVGLVSTPGNSSFASSNGWDLRGTFDRILRILGTLRLGRLHEGNDSVPERRQVSTVRTTATGTMDGHRERLRLTLEHKDTYRATAMAILPCVLGLLDGSIKKPGVHMMGHVLDPEQYMEDMWSMGMTVSLQGLPATWDEKSRTIENLADGVRPGEALINKSRLIEQVA
jgi:hypothetical protein